MAAENRPTIGLFICHLDNDYAYDICKGIEYAAQEADCNLVIFPGMYINAAYNDPQNAKYDYQYNSVFYYAKPESIDALIISIATIGTFLTDADNAAFLDHFKGIPILTLEAEYSGYPSMIIDSVQGLKQVINHLIHDHGKKRIGYVSGRRSSPDAQERLATYRATLLENDMKVDENLIVYGNFSEFCEEEVEDLLDRNPDLDAIVFANDQMALGGYNVLKRRKISIGEQLAVTGFDDVPLALALEPALTTVRANASELGYRALHQALNLIKKGKTTESRLPSNMILRESCGCTGTTALEDAEKVKELLTLKPKQLSTYIMDTVYACDKSSFFYPQLSGFMMQSLQCITEVVLSPKKKEFPVFKMRNIMREYTDSSLPLYYSIIQLTYSLHRINDIINMLIEDEGKKLSFNTCSNAVLIQLLASESSKSYNERKEYKANIWSTASIIRDTITTADNKELAYEGIGNQLQRLNFISTYLYSVNPTSIRLNADGSWRVPEELQLMVYNNNNTTVTTVSNHEMIPVSELFSNRYMPHGRRFTTVLVPIFTNEEHHGLFMCEVDIEQFHHIYSISLQLGTALKFMKSYDELQETNSQLTYTLSALNEKNRQLNNISTIDELTGLKNRRGFMTESTTVIKSDLNTGNKAILLFADMDNLKGVNDIYGHENGDFALRTIADTLRTCLRNGDVIGRIGGDEFVALALLGQQQSPDIIINRIKERLKKFNDASDKPYYVEASIGIVDFACRPEADLQALMKQADEALYEDKSKKRKSPVKADN